RRCSGWHGRPARIERRPAAREARWLDVRPRSPPVAANWHSLLLSERWLVHGKGTVTGERQFAATVMGEG
ncbi:MAG: hypothetical protein ACYDC1_20685, partial [Limisphaerales bacterium]